MPIKAPVAGVAMGLVMDEKTGKWAVLSDIAGAEDHYGDMDFKVAGTRTASPPCRWTSRSAASRWTSCARRSSRRARAGSRSSTRCTRRLPRRASRFPPTRRIVTIKIPVEKIRDVIGPGGKTIRSIIEKTGVKIDVEDDGRVNVASADEGAAARAIAMIQELTATPELNKSYLGRVERITDFGAFIEIMPGVDGLLHVSGNRELPRQGRARRAERRRAGDGQGDQHRSVRKDTAEPQGAPPARRRRGKGLSPQESGARDRYSGGGSKQPFRPPCCRSTERSSSWMAFYESTAQSASTPQIRLGGGRPPRWHARRNATQGTAQGGEFLMRPATSSPSPPSAWKCSWTILGEDHVHRTRHRAQLHHRRLPHREARRLRPERDARTRRSSSITNLHVSTATLIYGRQVPMHFGRAAHRSIGRHGREARAATRPSAMRRFHESPSGSRPARRRRS